MPLCADCARCCWRRNDFGGGASAECFKMVHGGIRYLQHADMPRLRASCRETIGVVANRSASGQPLPIAIPTYGHGRSGKAFLGTGARVYDLLTFDRNRGIRDPDRKIGNTRSAFAHRGAGNVSSPADAGPERRRGVRGRPDVLTPRGWCSPSSKDRGQRRSRCLQLRRGRTAFSGRATRCGACASRDQLSGDEFDVRARLTLNAAGPWADYLQRDAEHFGVTKAPALLSGRVLHRRPRSRPQPARHRHSGFKPRQGRAARSTDAPPVRRAPGATRRCSVCGTRYSAEFPDLACVQPAEVEEWMAEINTVYPTLQLKPSEVSFAHCGLVPFGETATATELSFGKESRPGRPSENSQRAQPGNARSLVGEVCHIGRRLDRVGAGEPHAGPVGDFDRRHTVGIRVDR